MPVITATDCSVSKNRATVTWTYTIAATSQFKITVESYTNDATANADISPSTEQVRNICSIQKEFKNVETGSLFDHCVTLI